VEHDGRAPLGHEIERVGQPVEQVPGEHPRRVPPRHVGGGVEPGEALGGRGPGPDQRP
jgi:hypothetical protein